MRLVHTADIHLDACFAAAGLSSSFAHRRRQSLRDAFHGIVRHAHDWQADALLIAGDLFDHERLSRDTIAFLRAEFEAIRPVPVIIAPGNHDPYIPASPYASETWPDNVFIFSKPEWSSFTFNEGRLVVHGFAFDGFDISSNPFGLLRVPEDGAIHVAVAHGSERAHQPPDGESYAPFDARAAAAPGLKYFALGHFHAFTPIHGSLGSPGTPISGSAAIETCICYSGAPEGHDFGETGPHYCLDVEIDETGVRVSPVPCARVIYATYAIDCTPFTNAQQLVEAIRAYPGETAEPQIARVTLSGQCLPAIAGELRAVYDAVAGDFEYLVLLDKTQSAENYETLALEDTSLGEFIRKLNAEIRDAPDEAQCALLERTREIGLAAYRREKMPIRGLAMEGEQP